jgi:glutamate-ammonia-ligase adenylyltransferase
VSLPEISSYSQTQIDELKKFSSVWQRYIDLLSRQTLAPDISIELRLRRHQAWLRSAAAEYFQTASTKEICEFWSKTANDLITAAYDQTKKNFPDLQLAVFAFGKLGAHELNLSSDIDVMLVALDENSQQVAFLRQFQSLLAESTEFGFVFRCDFDLRPGGRMGPLIPTLEQLKDYYGNYGEAWERLAFIRLREICGSAEVSKEVAVFTQKFIYRKHLDYTLLSDLKDLRQRIHSQNWHRSGENQLDLKLGLGGIRDLELFTHALQVVHGGKEPQLRVKETDKALELIGQQKILEASEAQFLVKHYWQLRHLENLVQARNDQQTHILTENFPLPFSRDALNHDLQRCDQLVSTLLGQIDRNQKSLPDTLEEQMTWLQSLGFESKKILEVWPDLISTSALSRQKERDELYRKRFLYLFLLQLAQYKNKDQALIHLRDFLKATRAKATFYSLLLNHEKLIDQLARIFVTSPYLSQVLCQRPELIDSFVLRSQDELEISDTSEILTHLLEKKYLSELIAGSDFLVKQNLTQLMEHASKTADKIASSLLKALAKEYSDHNVDLLCLGKWGGFELGLKSDLDFICVTENDPTELDLKIARRFLNRLTENHQRGGSLYSVDLRLRPQGQSGLMVTSMTQLTEYLSTRAHAWERQAYLRARFLLHPQLSAQIHAACFARPFTKEDLVELSRIRLELLKTNANSSVTILDLKYAEGGLTDLELAVQTGLLLQQSPANPGSSFQEHVENLKAWTSQEKQQFIDSWRLMRQAEQLYQALATESSSTLQTQTQAFVLTAEILKLSPEKLHSQLLATLQSNVALLKRLDPRRSLS